MHILIAPNTFKNSLPAIEVAKAIRDGLTKSGLDFTHEIFPVADGGDGTAQLITRQCHGSFIEAAVHDPLGRPIKASFGLIHGGATAVIDLATASGMHLLKPAELDPLHASTYGTGELIKVALDQGIEQMLIGVGGSATVDGGCGLLASLGVRFLDHSGRPLKPVPDELARLAEIDVSQMDQRMAECEFIVLCDVQNKLLGPYGAARIFGPQKGASPADVDKLELVLTRLDDVVNRVTGVSMQSAISGGAAGGASAGLYAFANARIVEGISYFLDVTNFDEALEKADLVITGEGSIDLQTLSGKAPYGVAIKAKENNIPVIALAGKIPTAGLEAFTPYFEVLRAINPVQVDIETALRNTASDLINTATEIGHILKTKGVSAWRKK